MASFQLVKVSENKVYLPNGKKLVLYKSNKDGTITLNPLFKQLNNDLQWTDNFSVFPPSCDPPQLLLPKFNSSAFRSTWINKDGLANLASINTGGPYQLNSENIWFATGRYPGFTYRYNWTAAKETQVKFLSELRDGVLVPMTTIDGDLTVYTGKEGTFDTWAYTNISVCVEPQAEIRFTVEIVSPFEETDQKPPYTEYLFFEYCGEKYKFAVTRVTYSPDSAFRAIVTVVPELLNVQKKIIETLKILGCPEPISKDMEKTLTLENIYQVAGTLTSVDGTSQKNVIAVTNAKNNSGLTSDQWDPTNFFSKSPDGKTVNLTGIPYVATTDINGRLTKAKGMKIKVNFTVQSDNDDSLTKENMPKFVASEATGSTSVNDNALTEGKELPFTLTNFTKKGDTCSCAVELDVQEYKQNISLVVSCGTITEFTLTIAGCVTSTDYFYVDIV